MIISEVVLIKDEWTSSMFQFTLHVSTFSFTQIFITKIVPCSKFFDLSRGSLELDRW